MKDPLASHHSNVTGFLNMLLAARDAKVKRFVYASSSAIYGDDPGLPKVEEKTGQPLSPYAATKAINEVYATALALAYGFPSIGLRYFNVFGPRQDPEGAYAAVIPLWIAALLRRQPIFINGDGENEPRLLLRRKCGAGQPPGRDDRQCRRGEPGLQRRPRPADDAQ